MSYNKFDLPDNLQGRSISVKVIPTVCNLKNMLHKLVEVNGDATKLKQWEKRSYRAYCIEEVQALILNSKADEWKHIIREHILLKRPSELGASAVDIYLVAYVVENMNTDKNGFYDYIRAKGISQEIGSANAIWQVGKGDGAYLGILNEEGRVIDWEFMHRWAN